jgi:hypothetical protein
VNVKEGRAEHVRGYEKQMDDAAAGSPARCSAAVTALFAMTTIRAGSGWHFQYRDIFDTDFDKYPRSPSHCSSATGITAAFTNLAGPEECSLRTRPVRRLVVGCRYGRPAKRSNGLAGAAGACGVGG